MRKSTYPIYISKRKEHSLVRFEMRSKMDACLYNDVQNFMRKHPDNLDGLVNMLIDGRFAHARFTEPEYPM